jgi:hypothetical protein
MSASSTGHETLNSVNGPIGIMRLVSNRSAENEANAKLIAAAPRLLSQLRALAVHIPAAGCVVPPAVSKLLTDLEGC